MSHSTIDDLSTAKVLKEALWKTGSLMVLHRGFGGFRPNGITFGAAVAANRRFGDLYRRCVAVDGDDSATTTG